MVDSAKPQRGRWGVPSTIMTTPVQITDRPLCASCGRIRPAYYIRNKHRLGFAGLHRFCCCVQLPCFNNIELTAWGISLNTDCHQLSSWRSRRGISLSGVNGTWTLPLVDHRSTTCYYEYTIPGANFEYHYWGVNGVTQNLTCAGIADEEIDSSDIRIEVQVKAAHNSGSPFPPPPGRAVTYVRIEARTSEGIYVIAQIQGGQGIKYLGDTIDIDTGVPRHEPDIWRQRDRSGMMP